MNANGSSTESGNAKWSELRDRINGRLVPRDNLAYDGDRLSALWNARKSDRLPDAIVHVLSESDVREVVRFAGRYGIKVAVRCGGHHFSAPSHRQGGILLDVGALNMIAVNPQEKTAVVQPGVSAGALMAALIPHGLAFPVGHCRTVPLGGFLLAGGFGWNGGQWGPACVSINGADIIDARGESVYVSADHAPDLFWALRGGAMGFPGVVTAFHLDVYPLPKVIRTSTLMFDVANMQAAARWLSTVQPSLPPQVECIGLVVSPPPDAQAQGAPPRVFAISATAFADSAAEAAKWLEPFDSGPVNSPAINTMTLVDTPFEVLFEGMDQAFPENYRYAADHVWSDSAPEALLESVTPDVISPPSARNFLLLALAPPARADMPPLPDMALSTIGGIYVGIYGVWDDQRQDADNIAWIRSMGTALDRYRTGRYVGEADLDAQPLNIRQCYAAGAWEKLASIALAYDPDERFFSFS